MKNIKTRGLMKNLWIVGLLIAGALLLTAPSHAQTLTLPSATSNAVQLNWTASTSCTTTTPCTYIPYRIAGTCPATLAGTTGWTALPATASQVLTATDATVTAGATYSFVVEAEQAGQNSGPSNCITLTIPNVLAPPAALSGTP